MPDVGYPPAFVSGSFARGTRRLARRGAGRLRRAAGQARGAFHDLPSARRNIQRLLPGAMPPPSAFAAFGDGTCILPSVRVENPQNVSLGRDVTILERSSLYVLESGPVRGPRLAIGDGVHLARFVVIVCGLEITIGEGVRSSDGVAIFDTWRSQFGRSASLREMPTPSDGPVVIGRNAYLGFHSRIWPGVTIGDGAYVGEGSVVVDDVAPGMMVSGNPAAVIGRYDPTTRAGHGQP